MRCRSKASLRAGAVFSGAFTHLGAFDGEVTGATSAVWTAADGDTVNAETVEFVIDFGSPIGANVYPFTQAISISGGTGRFAGATGFVNVIGTIDLNDVSYDGVVTGTISRPNSGL